MQQPIIIRRDPVSSRYTVSLGIHGRTINLTGSYETPDMAAAAGRLAGGGWAWLVTGNAGNAICRVEGEEMAARFHCAWTSAGIGTLYGIEVEPDARAALSYMLAAESRWGQGVARDEAIRRLEEGGGLKVEAINAGRFDVVEPDARHRGEADIWRLTVLGRKLARILHANPRTKRLVMCGCDRERSESYDARFDCPWCGGRSYAVEGEPNDARVVGPVAERVV